MPRSFAISCDGPTAWLPLVGSPTVALARIGEMCRGRKNSWVTRQVGARAACLASAAVAPLEAFGYSIALAAVSAGLVGRVTIRAINRILAGAVAGVWGLIYGNAITFSITVWIRRIVINVVLFARDFSIAWEHWMERTVAAFDLLWVSTRLWAFASKLDAHLRPFFNVHRVNHLTNQCWQHIAYSVMGLSLGVFSPGRQIDDCKERRIGSPMPGLPLSGRLWRCMMRQKWKLVTVASIAALGADVYVNGREGADQYKQTWIERTQHVSNYLYSHTFGLVADLRLLALGFLKWLEKDLELKDLQIKLAQEELKRLNTSGQNDLLPPKL